MFASIKAHIFFSIMLTAACLVSKVFAASVVAGSVGMFIACAVVLVKQGGPMHPVLVLLRESRALLLRPFLN